MPEMDGYEATGEIRRRELLDVAHGRTPVIALTASVLPQDTERCLAAGMDECPFKPVDIESLRRAVERYTQSKGIEAEKSPTPVEIC